MTYDHGANLRAQAGAHSEACAARHDELQDKITEFHRKGFLWTGPNVQDCEGHDDALDSAATCQGYEEWYARKQLCRTAAEIEAVQAEHDALFSQWVAEAVEDIARRALVWEQKQWQEDAA